jgi:hypothetical protein
VGHRALPKEALAGELLITKALFAKRSQVNDLLFYMDSIGLQFVKKYSQSQNGAMIWSEFVENEPKN